METFPGEMVHRFCLQHIKANLVSSLGSRKGVKFLCERLGTVLQERKFNAFWENLGERSEDAQKWLSNIDRSEWTLVGDGCHRWGISKTNASESFNNVLRGARRLPVRALVEATLEKTIRIYNRDYDAILECNTALTPAADKIFMKYRARAPSHQVLRCNPWTDVYEVKTSGRNVQIVRYAERACSCGKWQTFRYRSYVLLFTLHFF